VAAYESRYSKIDTDLTVLKRRAGFDLRATMLRFLALEH
jgi:hypothetical protein